MESEFSILKSLQDNFDVNGLATRMKKADWYYDYTDDRQVWQRGRLEINAIKNDLMQLSKLENGKQAANHLWDIHVPAHSVQRPAFLSEEQTNLSSIKNNTMIEKNYDYLSNQLKYTGFGEDLQAQLREKMQKQEPQFTLTFQKNYGKDETVATLQFRKSDENEMYFFNRYNLFLKNEQHKEPIRQTFYIGNNDANITLKEGYNLLSGRAVYKEVSNREGEKYNAWLQLNFKEPDANGGFKLKSYNDNYGYDLKATLEKHPIKELLDETGRQRLIESLERGNRQSVTLSVSGKDQKVFIEAVPQFKSLNFYEVSGQRLRSDKLYENNSQEQGMKEERKQNIQQGAVNEEEGPEMGNKKTKRRRQSIT